MMIVGAMCFGAFLCGAVVSTSLKAQNESSATLPSFSPPEFSFQKNLKLGDNSQDVRQLQIVLNSDIGTRISDSGIGSKGQESTYFGQLTANAVMRFQLKYRKEVLDPYNIYTPTGFVGSATRNKLNNLISSVSARPIVVKSASTASSSPTGRSQVSGPLPLVKDKLPRLYTARPQQIKKGDIFTLVGAGFQVENTVHIGTNVFPHVLPQDGNNISFVIPATSVIQNGTYEVWVENSQGISKVSGRPINLVISDNPQSAPVISSVSPANVSGTGMVTVTGAGFTSVGNSIVSGFGEIKNLSSSGAQITFSPKSLLSADAIARIPVGMTTKVDFYVINSNGISNVFGSVNLKL